MKSIVMPAEDQCPYCGHPLEMVTGGPNNPDAVPEVGDLSICFGCAGVLVFGDGLRVRKPDDAELADAMADPQVRLMIAGLKIVKARG